MADCVFCKIVSGEIPVDFVYETDNFVVFNDQNPSAPIHLLIVTRKHYVNLSDLPDALWVESKKIVLDIVKKRKFTGFRMGNNYGDSAQIQHFHMHLLSGISKYKKI